MADSVDRVFVHALNTVKRIPRLGSARPPPAERLKLYGLYKQSMEGDVDGVMDRPGSEDGQGRPNEELRGDQQKWDAWYAQRGITRTEAKRRYITTLIETMRVYANQTPDARELVSELEFVWDQIKSNPPSEKSQYSGRSQSDSNPQNGSPRSSSNRPIYPVMSERGSRNPRGAKSTKKRGRESVVVEGTDERGLRVLSPMSQPGVGDSEESEGDLEDDGEARPRRGVEDDTEGLEGDDFVDAPDSQIADGDRGSQHYASSTGDDRELDLPSPTSPGQRQTQRDPPPPQQRSAASAIIEPIAKYIQKQTSQRQPNEVNASDGTVKWQRRIEGALVKMNAEMAALREQLDMAQQHDRGSVYSSIVYPFSASRRPSHAGAGAAGRPKRGIVAWLLESAVGWGGTLMRHLVVDAVLLALITLYMHYRGIPPERLAELIASWIRRVRTLTVLRSLERLRKGETKLKLPAALRRTAPRP